MIADISAFELIARAAIYGGGVLVLLGLILSIRDERREAQGRMPEHWLQDQRKGRQG